MTDRTDHRTKAEKMLAYSYDYESTDQAGELSCLAYSAVHALLAIHDALTDLKLEPVTYSDPPPYRADRVQGGQP